MNKNNTPTATTKKTVFLSIFKWLLLVSVLLFALLALYIKYEIVPSLPDVESLRDVQYQTPLKVYSEDGKLLAQFGEKKRIPIQFDDVPLTQINAFLAAEDNRFFQHHGVDYLGLARAAVQLVLTGKKKQGGSTITMQVARNFFLTRKKTYTRKFREILLSFIIEQKLSKQDILALYLNKIYLGHHSYGIAAASQVYYGKNLADLSLAQQAMIAGLPKAPSAFNPISNPTRAKIRRDYVLDRLLRLKYINKEAFDVALAEPVTAELNNASIELKAPYIAEMVRDEMFKQYGNEIYTSGMKVFTTVNSEKQRAANQALRLALHNYDKRHGYRGVIGHLDASAVNSAEEISAVLAPIKSLGDTFPAVVTAVNKQQVTTKTKDQRELTIAWDGLKWARPYINEKRMGKNPKQASDILALGDVILLRQIPESDLFELSQAPQVAGAIVAMNPSNGGVLALVGGYDYYQSKFNRAFQANRQPGSGFKPILYSAALTKGYTAATLINDAPVVFNDAGLETQWRPENYSGKFYGPTRLRIALINSRNLVSIRILRDVGVNYVRQFARKFGLKQASLPKNLSLALGSGSANPYKMAAVYSVFANGGFKVTPYFVDRVESYSGDVLFRANPAIACIRCTLNTEPTSLPSQSTALATSNIENTADINEAPDKQLTPPLAERILSPQVNFLMNSLLRDVVKRGTGRKALSLGRTDLAGKTGTTNDQKDAWFNGYNPSLVAVSWVGFDDSRSLGNRETGGKASLPMWIAFMRKALENIPNQNLPQPNNIVNILIDKETGFKTTPSNPNAVFELFRKDFAPEMNDETSGRDSASPLNQQQTIEDLF
ncbi:MAG: peptidase [Piscirickettsiaceae bacterium]|nr:MAG: peptidase [Piscirickettsiaceae bacterium]